MVTLSDGIRVAALAAGLALVPMHAGAQSVLSVETETSGEAYLAALDSIVQDIYRQMPSEIAGQGPLLTIDPDGDVADMEGFDSLSSADRALALSARRLFDLYRELGGRPDTPLFIQRTNEGLFTARDGGRGEVAGDADEGLANALGQLASSDQALSGGVPSALQGATSVAQVIDVAREEIVEAIATLPRGGRVEVSISGPDVSAAGRDAALVGPEGTHVALLRTSGDTLKATLGVGNDTPTGFSELRLFSGSDAIRPVAAFDVIVTTGGKDGLSTIADDHGNSAADATALLDGAVPGARVVGAIEHPNDVDVFRVMVPAAGALRVATAGGSDMTARLIGDDGDAVATDDDAGKRYNAALATSLAPGVYLLELRHCCGGTGPYRLEAAFAAF